MLDKRTFLSLRHSLFMALGLGVLACGSEVSTGGSAGGNAECTGEMPVLLPDGTDSGYLRCDDGTIHRRAKVTCDPTITQAACIGTEPLKLCTTDADCTAKPYGRCAHFDPGDTPDPSCGCVYSCADDSDCDQGSVCVCNGVVDNGVPWAACSVVTKCTTDADCASGQCGITSYSDGCSQQVGLACRSASDACRVDADCNAGYQCVAAPYQSMPSTSPFTCETQNCAIGRPLLVAGKARTAPGEKRGDWARKMSLPELGSLTTAERNTLAAAWSEIAALEHASIGSFARFSLSLLALGAPAHLLRLAQEAAADEVEHARVAYSLAGHFKGEPVGPSRLDLSGAAVETDERAVLAALIEEACVGETLGAAEALAISTLVADPALAAVHARIAADEERHAELAWKTLRFLLEGADPEMKRFCAEAFSRAIEAAGQNPAPRGGEVAPELGLLSEQEIGEIRRQALRDVVRPLANAILCDAARARPAMIHSEATQST